MTQNPSTARDDSLAESTLPFTKKPLALAAAPAFGPAAFDAMGGKTVFLVVSNKGGAGKSFVAKALADLLRNAGLQTLLADLDKDNRSLTTLFARLDPSGNYDHQANEDGAIQTPPDGALLYNIKEQSGLKGLANRLLAPKLDYRAAVLDFPAGPQEELGKLFGGLEPFAKIFLSKGIRLVIFSVVNFERGAAEGVPETIRAWGPGVKLLVAKNLIDEERKDGAFQWYDGSLKPKALAPSDAVRMVGGAEMEVPILYGAGEILPEAEARHTPLSKLSMGMVEDFQVQNFFQAFEEAFWPALEKTLSSSGSTKASLALIDQALEAQKAGGPQARARIDDLIVEALALQGEAK